jgi:hypothetical protein
MGVSVGKFAVVGMASFDLVLFEWLRGVQARDCGDSGVLYAIVVGLVLGVWCLVLGAWFWISSIPSVSAAEDFFVLAGWRSRLQGKDQWCVFWIFAGGVFSFVRSFFPLFPVVRFCLVRSVRRRFKYKFC